jgi:hypothetical protein
MGRRGRPYLLGKVRYLSVSSCRKCEEVRMMNSRGQRRIDRQSPQDPRCFWNPLSYAPFSLGSQSRCVTMPRVLRKSAYTGRPVLTSKLCWAANVDRHCRQHWRRHAWTLPMAFYERPRH